MQKFTSFWFSVGATCSKSWFDACSVPVFPLAIIVACGRHWHWMKVLRFLCVCGCVCVFFVFAICLCPSALPLSSAQLSLYCSGLCITKANFYWAWKFLTYKFSWLPSAAAAWPTARFLGDNKLALTNIHARTHPHTHTHRLRSIASNRKKTHTPRYLSAIVIVELFMHATENEQEKLEILCLSHSLSLFLPLSASQFDNFLRVLCSFWIISCLTLALPHLYTQVFLCVWHATQRTMGISCH